jgi:hypothetical protein
MDNGQMTHVSRFAPLELASACLGCQHLSAATAPPAQRARAEFERLVRVGAAICARCGRPIGPGQNWDLDHRDDRLGYLGASHRGCNVAAANARRAKSARPDGVPPDDRAEEDSSGLTAVG